MLDVTRHRPLFDPSEFGEIQVSIVGVGGIGSAVCWNLLRLGVQNIAIFDPDRVEGHNLANQLFGMSDVGLPKVEALSRSAMHVLDEKVHGESVRVASGTALGEVVFLCVDRMHDRKVIMEQCCFGNPGVKRVFDARMDASHGVVYSIDPNKSEDRDEWLRYWFPDADANNDTAACGGKISVCYTAGIVAGLMAHEFVRWTQSLKDPAVIVRNQRWFNLNDDTMEGVVW